MKLTCPQCGWKQGHFWNSERNPIRDLLTLEKDLLNEDLDGIVAGVISGQPSLPRRVSIAVSMQALSSQVLNMKWRTKQEWDDAGCPDCPSCGGTLEMESNKPKWRTGYCKKCEQKSDKLNEVGVCDPCELVDHGG